jgi:phosphopantothenoylcysteine decarboxylase/phosphopantothenate--cysteine ligase
MSLAGKKILLGVSGGIAAYKTPELVRELTRAGAVVQVVLTRAAHQFVTATSLQAVSGRAVRDDLWDPAAEAAMGHIELARWADLVVIAPATAHCLAKLATGAADDLLSTICLATATPVVVAPAMNQQMWQHVATRRNVARLIDDGVRVLGPGSGDQACGEVGPGRMLEPAQISAALAGLFASTPLTGLRALVTAGPTREPIDPVRYISNHSSGKQGYALAKALLDAGAVVTLVSGPVALSPPPGVELVPVTTAIEMYDAVMARLAGLAVFVGVAAVADYRPTQAAPQKLKKARAKAAATVVTLTENPDIIAAVARAPNRPFVVGFAAETERPVEHARAKLAQKGLDLIAVNDVSDKSIGFESNANAVTLISAAGCERLPRADKGVIATAIVERIAAALNSRNAAGQQC